MTKLKFVKIKKKGDVIIPQCTIAQSSFQRLKGLIGTKEMKLENSLLFEGGCQQMHSLFMKVSIDVLFLNKENRVIGICSLKPWRMTPFYFKAQKVIEAPLGFSKALNISKGDHLEIES